MRQQPASPISGVAVNGGGCAIYVGLLFLGLAGGELGCPPGATGGYPGSMVRWFIGFFIGSFAPGATVGASRRWLALAVMGRALGRLTYEVFYEVGGGGRVALVAGSDLGGGDYLAVGVSAIWPL